jgi:TonB family protein
VILRRLSSVIASLWLVSCAGTLPAQESAVVDSPGVTVDLNGSLVLHRTSVKFPVAARQDGTQGTVIAEVTLDGKGNVSDVRVLNGPVELRRAVLESLLQWHFASDAANGTRQVTVHFELGDGRASLPRGPDFIPSLVVSQPGPAGPLGRRIKSIVITGLPPSARDDLLRRLPVHEGDILSEDLAIKTGQIVRDFDEHLGIGFPGTSSGETNIQITLPGYVQDPERALPIPVTAPTRVKVAPNVAQAKLKSSVTPQYPPLARQARIQGIVKLNVVIGRDGMVQNISVISGHPLLVPAAIAAVKQWVFEPTQVNGAAVEVEAPLDINFDLPPQ